MAKSHARIEHVGLDGQLLPPSDASCDGALSTFTLCTILDVAAALGELRRVLRPGGRFHFLEHGIAPDAGVAAWQRRLSRCSAGWPTVVTSPATQWRWCWRRRLRGAAYESRFARGPKPWSYMTEGFAISAWSRRCGRPTR